MAFSWNNLERPIAALAPMADLTDSSFCRLVKKYGADVMFREMISAEAVVHENEKTLKMAQFENAERPLIQQIFGKEPGVVAEAARIIAEKMRPDGIDLNMGCPVRKLTADFNGAALMREPKLAAAIVKAVKNAVKVPVSVKTRLGWSEPEECLAFAPRLEAAGADLISIHGRTKAQGYTGRADWTMIGRVRKTIKIPLLANGDIDSPDVAAEALKTTDADGVLIGRGALGNPWILKQIKEKFVSGETRTVIGYEERKRATLEHFRLAEERYGERAAILMRKHLVWYWRGIPRAQELRQTLVRIAGYEDLITAYADWEQGTDYI